MAEEHLNAAASRGKSPDFKPRIRADLAGREVVIGLRDGEGQESELRLTPREALVVALCLAACVDRLGLEP